MTKFTLIGQETLGVSAKVTYEFEAEYLPDILSEIENFLRALTFHIDYLEHVKGD